MDERVNTANNPKYLFIIKSYKIDFVLTSVSAYG